MHMNLPTDPHLLKGSNSLSRQGVATRGTRTRATVALAVRH
jgi:hypothetical protein